MNKCPTNLLDALILQGLTLGRLPKLIVTENTVKINWIPDGVCIAVSVRDLPIIYDCILFHAADSPLSADEVIASARVIASTAMKLGVEVEYDRYRRIKI